MPGHGPGSRFPADLPRRAHPRRAEAVPHVPGAPYARLPGKLPRQPGLRAVVRLERDGAGPGRDPRHGPRAADAEMSRAFVDESDSQYQDEEVPEIKIPL